MSMNWASRTAETLRGAKEAEKQNTELFLKHRGMIVAQATSLWNSLCATVRERVSELSQIEPYLRMSKTDPGISELIVTSPKGHMVIRLDRVPSIQFEIYRARRDTVDEPETKDNLTFHVSSDQVWLTSTEGLNMSSTQAAEYLLDKLIALDQAD